LASSIFHKHANNSSNLLLIMELFFSIVYAFGSLICHQRPERSFFWGDHQFPVCARCTGLYLGSGAGFIGWIGFKAMRQWRLLRIDPRVARNVMIAVLLPTAASVASGTLGIWDGTNVVRAALALPLGAFAGVIVAAVATKDLR
jgi:uncharacterized membrane protein